VDGLRAAIARAQAAGARPEDIATLAEGRLSRRLVFTGRTPSAWMMHRDVVGNLADRWPAKHFY